jgi:phytoene/squalene synthetase
VTAQVGETPAAATDVPPAPPGPAAPPRSSAVRVRRPARVRRAARQLGRAFQLTNFARDVGEDLRRGRTCLPAPDLDGFRVTAAALEWHGGILDELVRRDYQGLRGRVRLPRRRVAIFARHLAATARPARRERRADVRLPGL